MTTSPITDPSAAPVAVDPFAAFLESAPATPAAPLAGSYQAMISRNTPGCILFVCDQSASMDESFQTARTKANALADTVNNAIANLIASCTRSDGCRHYFDIGVIGYGGSEAVNALSGSLASSILQPVTRFEESPLRVEDRSRKVSDGAGGIVEEKIKFPVWLEPRMSGGTPMCTALRKAHEVVAAWCTQHPDSYPPTVIHVTDGQSTDGSPDVVASQIRSLSTRDGNALLFNLHIASTTHRPEMFPDSESRLPDANAKVLFGMSSLIPPSLATRAAERGFKITHSSRFFGYNADLVSLAHFMQLGSSAAQQR